MMMNRIGYKWQEICMSVSSNRKLPSALKHAAYSATTILPGEDQATFEKLHQELISEYSPNGASEHETIFTLARLMWRKKNLATFQVALAAQSHYAALREKLVPTQHFMNFMTLPGDPNPNAVAASIQAAKELARKELGKTFELVEIGEEATIECLMKKLEVEERLDSLIDKCLKRLLFVRGIKSLAASPSTGSTLRLSSRPKAAA